ncbi:uncharacterized protein V1518DRAFT_424008 [Limtongia smithiae]|uniref:uncharacterized protein n=1 Tax=Limtongia smithiae TaxID=1125753 RepID=UPI0034CFA886
MDRKAQPFPTFDDSLPFSSLLYQIELHIVRTVDSPYSYEQLRGPPFSTHLIRPLVRSLVQTRHPAILAALLAARLDFAVQEDDRAIHEARAYTAELVATRYASHLPENELIQYLTYEIPRKPNMATVSRQSSVAPTPMERVPLLSDQDSSNVSVLGGLNPAAVGSEIDLERQDASENTPYVADSAIGLSALELAILGDAKKFLLSRAVEDVVASIWDGRIVFWDSISIAARKRASFYNPRRPGNDWYSRLRVPKYRMFFMMLNYAVLLALYYAVLTQRQTAYISSLEIALDLWFAGFVYEEIGQVRESGSIRYYVSDYWSAFDLTIIFVFLAYFICRLVSVMPSYKMRTADAAFDILALEALLLVPRVFSLLSITPYFGTLLPCLKQMTKDFLKFLVLIVILYVGFLTTFSFLGRDQFTVNQMAWLLIRVFFGAPYDGLDAASLISPIFGPTLMLIFVILTNVLLITVVISILSQRFGQMMNNANEEYILLFSSLVMESITTSDRVTYFYPPLNLIGILIRPLRLFLTHNEYRTLRIWILKVTHAPLIALLWVYEHVQYILSENTGEKRGKLLHLKGPKSKTHLWKTRFTKDFGTGGSIAQGLFIANQTMVSTGDPLLSASGGYGSSFANQSASELNNSNENSKWKSARSNGGGSTEAAAATGMSTQSGVATHRKIRKGTIVAQNIRRSQSGLNISSSRQRPPLAVSAGTSPDEPGAGGQQTQLYAPTPVYAVSQMQLQSSTPATKSGLGRSQTARVSGATSDPAHMQRIRKSRLAISILRDLRQRRSSTMPAYNTGNGREDDDVASENGTVSSTGATTRHVAGARALAGSTEDLGEGDEQFGLTAMKYKPATFPSVSSADEDPEEEEEEEYEDEREEEDERADEHRFPSLFDNADAAAGAGAGMHDDDEDEGDDDAFLNLYADQTTVHMRALEEQVYKMKEMLEKMNMLLVENLEKDGGATSASRTVANTPKPGVVA